MALVYCRSVLVPGDILQVDTVWGPRAPGISGGFYAPVTLVQSLLAHVVGTGLVSRLYVIGAVALVGLGPMIVFRRGPWWVAMSVAVVGVWNPWVYERVADGQWTVVAGAGLLFLWVAAWWALLRRPTLRTAVAAVVTAVLATAFSPHVLGMVLLLGVASAIGGRVWREAQHLRWVAGTAGATVLALSYGLVSFLVGAGADSYERVRTFGAADISFFAATADPRYGLFANLIGLQGYWAERVHRFVLPYEGAGWWPLPALFVVGLALAGAWLRRDKVWLLVAGLIALAISASTAVPVGINLVDHIIAAVPALAAYREPEKWSAVWLIAECVLAGAALSAILVRHGLLARVLAAALVIATMLPAGLNAALHLPESLTASTYPGDWRAAAAYLDLHVSASTPVLALPWHLYEALPFAGNRIVQNPAPVIFPGTVLSSLDPEVDGAAPLPSPGDVGPAATAPMAGCALADAVRRAGVTWVVVEPVLEGPDDAASLIGCGFVLRFGSGANTVEVLQDSRR
jgi:hypothetical protein